MTTTDYAPQTDSDALNVDDVQTLAACIIRSRQFEWERRLRAAARLAAARRIAGYTQEQVAQVVGCQESEVSRWEAGKSIPSGMRVLSLADLFGLDPAFLLGESS